MDESGYRVFLSYSRKDGDFVRELYRRLTRDGVSCFFDQESIGWGDNWVKALERGIDQCEHIVFVLSPDFCNSEWAEVERTSSIADDPRGLKRKVLPLMRRTCDHLQNYPRFLRQVQTIDVSSGESIERDYPKICAKLGGIVRDERVPADRTKLPPVGTLPARCRMPYLSIGDQFVGRVEDIWKLHDFLFRDGTTVLQGSGVVVGTGGLGKTQVAIEYVWRLGSAYNGGVYWVDADQGLGKLIDQVGKAAGIDVDGKAEEPVQVEQIWRELNARQQPFLVVLDNFPDKVPLRPYLPTAGRAHTIVTTRRQDLGHATVRLNMLSPEEGAGLLNSGARNFGVGAEGLSEQLGGLPLALELAKSYLNYRRELSVNALLEEMKSAGEMEVLDEFASEYREHLPNAHERNVAATFQMSWDAASEKTRAVLRVLGELAPVAVPRRFLRMVLEWPELSPMKDVLGRSVSELVRLSLTELDTAQNPVSHRLILAFARHRNRVDGASPFDACVEAIQREMRRTFDNPDAETNGELESLAAHAEFLAGTGRMGAEEFGELLNSLGTHHMQMGRLAAARSSLEKALESAEKSFAPGHPSIAIRQSNLALVLQDLGQLEKARDLLRRALESDEKSFVPGHPTIAIRQSNLATVLKDLGRLEEARDLLRRALESAEKSFAPGHSSIARSQSNLALVLQDLGQLEEARELLVRALESNEKAFAPGHPSIAIGQSNLALVLQDLGQLEEARDLLRRALESDEKSFAPGNPFIAIGQSNLAMVLKDLGQLEEARDLMGRALASAEKSFAPGHSSIAIRQSNLATVLQDLGQLEEARDLLRQALESDEKSFAPGHSSVAIRQSNLATVLQDLGQLEEARDLLRRALESDEKSFAPGHPSIARSQSNLAMVYRDLGQLEEARDLMRRALTSDEKLYAPGHPSISIRQSNLAMVLKDLGQLEEARDLLRRAYAASLRQFGPDHRTTRKIKGNLDGLPKVRGAENG